MSNSKPQPYNQAGIPQSAPNMPMGVVHTFNESDPRWQCACGMHSRQGTKIIVLVKAVMVVLQLIGGTVYFYETLRYQLNDYGDYGDSSRHKLDSATINAVYITVIVLTCLIVFIPLGLLAKAAWGADKRWMVWPFLILSGCGIGGSVCTLNPLGILECFFFFVVYRFDNYLKYKEMFNNNPPQVVIAGSSQQQPLYQPSAPQSNYNPYPNNPDPAYNYPAPPPAYSETVDTKAPIP